MYRRLLIFLAVGASLFGLAGCHNSKVKNPIAEVDSKQPDKVLFDRAMDAMKHNRFEVARMTLQTLINTYPESEFLARAKLSIGDSWYAEGGTAALAQAAAEYKDFITFFPNMPEAAEAQMKIGHIEFQQMEKPDRDYTHAKRAEDEYRQMILQFPDSKLVPEAKERLREVQEVLGEREFRIGRFYHLRGEYIASIARLKSLSDAYPLYSGSDEALFLLGDAYEKQVAMTQASRLPDDTKARMSKDFADHAADAYSRILTRYPVTDRAPEAKKRLEAMKRPIPTPTQEAIALNKAEEESRGKVGMWSSAMEGFRRHPMTATTARIGEPTLADPKITSAPQLIKDANSMATGKGSSAAGGSVSIETVPKGTPPPNEPVPRSESPSPNESGIPELKPMNSDANSTPAAGSANSTPVAGSGGGGDSSPAQPPAQVNDAAQPGNNTASSTSTDDSQNQSSSKKKKKRFKVF